MSLKYASVLLVAVWLHLGQTRRLSDQLDNEINSNPNDIDIEKPADDWVRISQPPPPVIRQSGNTVELECEAVGSPAPTLQWLKGSAPVTENESFKNNAINDKQSRGLAKVRSIVVVQLPSGVHEATFTCLAESGSQVATAKTTIYVSGGSSSERRFVKKPAEELLVTRNRPRIILYDVIHMDNIGSDVVLPCKVTGNPKPNIIWLDPKEEVIEDNPRVTVLQDGGLRIKNVRWNDMGTYVCVAKSSFGEDSITTFVYPMMAEK